MVNDTGKLAPYAPLANVISMIRRKREKGLPEVLSSQNLPNMGITEGNVSRTLQALRFLNLIDEEGRQMEAFHRIAKASSAEYPQVLGEIIKAAYSDVFVYIDPAEANDVEMLDAFRSYQPEAQRSRMIILFRGLCQEAGLISGGPPETRKRTRTGPITKSSVQSNGSRKVQGQPKFDRPVHTELEAPVVGSQSAVPGLSPDYSLLYGLLKQLPQLPQEEKKWTQAHRDRWLQAFTSTVDLLIEVKDPELEADYS